MREFSAGNTDPAVFEAGDETENDSAVESGDEFGAGELKQELDDAFENRQETPTEDKEPCGDPVYSRQSAEGYVMQLFSEGKLEKTYIIPYAGVDTAKAPEALKRKGYIFKEWNTKEDSTGKVFKPGDSIKELLVSADMEVSVQEAGEEADEESESDASSDINLRQPDPETSADGLENPAQEEMQEADTEEQAAEIEVVELPSAEEDSKNPVIALYAVWEKAPEYKITYKLNKGKNNKSNPGTYTSEDEIKLKKPSRSGYHFAGWYADKKYKTKVTVIKKGSKGAVTLYAKWIKEISPSAKAAVLNSVKGTKANTITASATVLPTMLKVQTVITIWY